MRINRLAFVKCSKLSNYEILVVARHRRIAEVEAMHFPEVVLLNKAETDDNSPVGWNFCATRKGTGTLSSQKHGYWAIQATGEQTPPYLPTDRLICLPLALIKA
jgi:hypothetical protein